MKPGYEEYKCKDCGGPFWLSEEGKAHFINKGLALPRRCKPCRVANSERRAAGETAGGSYPQNSSSSPSTDARKSHKPFRKFPHNRGDFNSDKRGNRWDTE